MKKLLSLLLITCLSSCGILPEIKKNEYEVLIEVRYEYLQPLTNKKVNYLDLNATIYIFNGLLQNNSGLVFDGNGNMVGNGKTVKYDQILYGGVNTVKFKKGYHTLGIVSGEIMKNGKYATHSGTINVDGSVDNAEAYHLFEL